MGGMDVSTTITTHVDDLEYGTCEGDADKFLAMRYGVGYPRRNARVYAGNDQLKNGTHISDKDGLIEKNKPGAIVTTATRSDSSSSVVEGK
jgi:hypothetical protein